MYIELKTLGISFESPFDYFRDDGSVESVEEHTRKVFIEFFGEKQGQLKYNENMPSLIEDCKRNEGSSGFLAGQCCSLKGPQGEKSSIIFYSNRVPLLHEPWVRSHEETHALHNLGQLWRLEEKMQSYGMDTRLLRRFSKFSECSTYEKEMIANFGSFFILDRLGFYLKTANKRTKEHLDIYQGLKSK